MYKTREIKSRTQWEKYNLSRNPESFLQSWYWGEVNKKLGNKVIRLGVFVKSKLIGVAQMIKQDAKRGPHFIIPAGPVIDWGNKRLVGTVIRDITRIAKRENVWFVRVRPEARASVALKRTFRNAGLNPAPMHLHGENTLILDIDRPEEEILKTMRKNTRYDVRRSTTEGYKFRTSVDKSDVDHLYNLQAETVGRFGFVGFPKELFLREIKEFANSTKTFLAVCKKRKVLAVALVVLYGDKAYYHFSGSADIARKSRANYFLQWNIIKEAKKRGAKSYDFWGVAPEGSKKHRFSGVTTFKKGFGGEAVDWLHAQDIVVSPLYWLTYLFEIARKYFRKL